jgi:hypothetical protein
MDGKQFDALTRVWGSTASRRRVLSGLLATTGLLGWRRAGAQGNSDCAHFCKEVFPPGKQRGQCVSDAAHGEGLCAACGADVERLCVDRTGAQVCCTAQQDCGLTGLNQQGCCLPPGAELPGGCSFETLDQCCGFPCTPGSTSCVVQGCNRISNTCVNPTLPSVASADEGEIITEVIGK